MMLQIKPKNFSKYVVKCIKKYNLESKMLFQLKGWSGSENDTFGLSLKNCNELCPKADFETILEPIIPSEDELQMLKKDMAHYVPKYVYWKFRIYFKNHHTRWSCEGATSSVANCTKLS